MKVTEGLYTDCSPQDQPQGTYRFAKNIVGTNSKGAIENEKGFSNLGDIVPYNVIGVLPVGKDLIVFSTNNTNSEIGKISSGVYTSVYSSTDLNFNTSAPIKAVFYQNFLGETVVAWIDDINVPRIINIDDPDINDINDLRLFPLLNVPSTSYTVNDSGGSLLSGVYQFSVRYRSNDGTTTNWIGIDRVLRVSDDTTSVGFGAYDGIAAGTVTPKSITLTITGTDTRYDFVDIAVIETIGGITTAKQVKSLPTSGGVITTTYSGGSAIAELTLDEILVQGASYDNAKAITSLDNRLFLANLTSDDLLDYQQYANNIRINYTYRATTANVLTSTSSKLGDTSAGFQHGEAYAFYLVFLLKNGGYSRAFHIPGRAPETGEQDISQFADGQFNDQNLPSTAKTFQVEDTSTNAFADTNMGFWENEDELYPNTDEFNSTSLGGPDLRNQKVRHHRFPTIRKMRSVTGDSDYGRTKIHQLGINISNVNIPASIRAKISGWQVFYAKRDYANSTVIGQTLFQYGAAHQASTLVGGGGTEPAGSEGIMSTGGNWRLDNTGGDSGSEMWPYTGSIRFNDFDLLSQKPSIAPTYITNQVRLTLDMTGLTQSGSSSGRIITGNDLKRYLFANYWGDATSNAVLDTEHVRSISEPKYIPVNTLDGDYNNTASNETYVAKITNGASLPIATLANDPNNKWDGGTSFIDDTYLCCLQQYRTNIYDNFSGQQLVATDSRNLDLGGSFLSTSLSNIYGGDTYVNLYSMLAHNPTDGDDLDFEVDPEFGFRVIKYFVGETRNNVGLRNEVPGNANSLYYPKSGVDHLFDYDMALPRTFGYNTDYSKVNDLNAISVFTPYTQFTTEFPHTIIYSVGSQTEDQDISWRTFPADNAYTMPRNRGDIINLQGIGNEDLLIHHEESLFRTKTNRSLQTEAGQVVLGSSSIFALPPQEVLSDDTGYAGTQHKFGCLLTKAGYLFTDVQEGKVFLYHNNTLEEISSYGQRIFFRDFMREDLDDNPFNSTGITAAFDEEYNRVLLTKKNGSSSFTTSYDPLKKQWKSFHSYIPDWMVSTADKKLYSFKDGSLYQHHIGNYGVFYTGSPESSFIDIVMNQEPQNSKILSSIEWVTEVMDSAGILDNNETFDYITVRSLQLCSGRIELEKAVNISSSYNTRLEEREWHFNQFRNVAIANNFLQGFYNNYDLNSAALSSSLDWFNQGKMIDKFFITRLEYSNTTNKELKLLDVGFGYRLSFR